MTATEHVLILLSLVISLALAHVLNGIARLVHAENVAWSRIHLVWIVIALLMLVDFWMSAWQLRHEDDWNILMVLFWMTMAVLFYLICALMVPDTIPNEGIDLSDFHETNRRRYLGLFLFTMLFSFTANLTLSGFATANVIVVLNAFCLAAAGFSKSMKIQWAGTIGTSILFVVYFAIFMSDF